MKSLMIKLAVATTMLTSLAASAEHSAVVEDTSKSIVTIRVVAENDPAGYEVFSLSHAKAAIDETVEMMVNSLSGNETAAVADTAKPAGSAI